VQRLDLIESEAGPVQRDRHMDSPGVMLGHDRYRTVRPLLDFQIAELKKRRHANEKHARTPQDVGRIHPYVISGRRFQFAKCRDLLDRQTVRDCLVGAVIMLRIFKRQHIGGKLQHVALNNFYD
jgi:hypothetical protein